MQKDAYTIQELDLAVGDGHTLHIVDWGNKASELVVIFLHGGPGSSVQDKHKASFDPRTQRVIFFDQRGCGLSTPYGSLENNTTQDMIADITKIADQLNLPKFVLHGSSWGSTLALSYAIAHPDRVRALAIGGVFTGAKREVDWLDNGEFKTFYPEVWQAYLERTPAEHHDDPTAYHVEKVLNGNPEEQKASGYAYDCLEGAVLQFDDRFTPEEYADYDPAGIRVEMYYLSNGCFMPNNYILDNAHKLTMPVYIVQGRYDMVCPPATAYELHSKLKNSQLYWTLSGHRVEHEGQNIFRAIFANL